MKSKVVQNLLVTQASKNFDPIAADQLFNCSAQIFFTDAASAGTLKLQGSNDFNKAGNFPGAFTPTHWNDITGASVVVAAGATSLIPKTDISYNYIRLVWTRTAGAGTMTLNVNVQGI